ncbi:MAG: radical SAM protein [Desulfurococcaceae archaeon]|nr:radical SAM protein [Desulfurococcaceae archaeon]
MLKLRYSEWELTLNEDSKPKEVMIEVTTLCNYSCIHCFRNNMFNESLGIMSKEVFNKVVNELGSVGVEKVVFSGWGEPLTHPEIINFLREVKDLGVYTVLNTNGSLLSRYADDIYKLEVDEVVVSVDSVETDVYESIRVGGVLSDVIKGLLRINDLRGYGVKPTLTLWFTINTINFNDIPKIASYARNLGFNRVVLSHTIPLSIEYERLLTVYSNTDLIPKLTEVFDKLSKEVLAVGGQISLPKNKVGVERLCPFINNNALFIRWDGYVTPCIHYAHNWRYTFLGVDRYVYAVKFGDLRREGLIDIWRNSEYIRFRFRSTFFTQPSCLDCTLVNYCTYTINNMHDCWGNSPTCAHCPYSHNITRCPL